MSVNSADQRQTAAPQIADPRLADTEDRIDPQGLMPPRTLAERLRAPLMIGVPAVVLVVALVMYLTGGRIQSTDDAYVQAARVQVSSNISGRVVEVAVHENQLVKKGDVLFRLDSAPLDTALAQSEAMAAQARLQVDGYRALYQQRIAETAAAADQLRYQTKELARQTALLQSGVTSQAGLDLAQNAVNAARQRLNAAKEAEAQALAVLGGAPDRPVDQHPSVRAALAQAAKDRLNRSYGVVLAPQDGIVTKVEQLQVGDYVNAAQPLFALVSPRVWIDANLKEDQLAHVRPGQKAEVRIDARKDVVYHGKVASLSPGTGSSFALLPPENATGNWVKVVQRVAVRIELDPKDLAAHPLQAGLSAKVSIDTGRSRTGGDIRP
jgi:membrane fusion protein (multidrug efflux system)